MPAAAASMRAITTSMWATTSSVWNISSSMWAVVTFVHDAQALFGLSHPMH